MFTRQIQNSTFSIKDIRVHILSDSSRLNHKMRIIPMILRLRSPSSIDQKDIHESGKRNWLKVIHKKSVWVYKS